MLGRASSFALAFRIYSTRIRRSSHRSISAETAVPPILGAPTTISVDKCSWHLPQSSDLPVVRLLDAISHGRCAAVRPDDGRVLPGAERFAEDIRACPLR